MRGPRRMRGPGALPAGRKKPPKRKCHFKLLLFFLFYAACHTMGREFDFRVDICLQIAEKYKNSAHRIFQNPMSRIDLSTAIPFRLANVFFPHPRRKKTQTHCIIYGKHCKTIDLLLEIPFSLVALIQYHGNIQQQKSGENGNQSCRLPRAAHLYLCPQGIEQQVRVIR